MKIQLTILLLISRFLYAQQFSFNDILGPWEVSKCELFSGGELIKTARLDNAGIDEKLVEGKYVGKLDQDINSTIKALIGSVITFDEDSTVSWDGATDALNFNHEFWQLSSTGQILICKYENKFRMRPLLFVGRIIYLNGESMVVAYFESGFEARISFTKK